MQTEVKLSLPQPDDASAQHSDRVAAHIRRKIDAAGGEISFAEYMHEVLYAPRLGYYSAGSAKLGPAGDFVTAPEVSSLYGRLLARQCREVLAPLESGAILEVGAGSGKLAVDLLAALQDMNALPSVYLILEVSADLQQRQQECLFRNVPQLADRVRWISKWPELFTGVIIANEVLDALPVERFVFRTFGVVQQCVAHDGQAFIGSERAAPKVLENTVIDIIDEIESDIGQPLADGYASEVSLAAPAWIADISGCLDIGAVFLFDYGVSRREYYAPDRSNGWLRCHFRHHVHDDPLIFPGIQDLSTWVDFSLLAAAAGSNALDILGYQSQSQFLIGAGLDAEMQNFESLSTRQQLELSGQIKTLTLPGEMGENFKCMVLGRGDVVTPSAFDFADRTPSL